MGQSGKVSLGFPIRSVRAGREILKAAGPAIFVLVDGEIRVREEPLIEFVIVAKMNLKRLRGKRRNKI